MIMNTFKLVTSLRIVLLSLFCILVNVQIANAQFNHWKQASYDKPVKSVIVKKYDGKPKKNNEPRGEIQSLTTTNYSTDGFITDIVEEYSTIYDSVVSKRSNLTKYKYQNDQLLLLDLSRFKNGQLNGGNYEVFTKWSEQNHPLESSFTTNKIGAFAIALKDTTRKFNYSYDGYHLVEIDRDQRLYGKIQEMKHYVYSYDQFNRLISENEHRIHKYHGEKESKSQFQYYPENESNWQMKIEERDGEFFHSTQEVVYFNEQELIDKAVTKTQYSFSNVSLPDLTLDEMYSNIKTRSITGDNLYWTITGTKFMIKNFEIYENYFMGSFDEAYKYALEDTIYAILPQLGEQLETIANQHENNGVINIYADFFKWNGEYYLGNYQAAYDALGAMTSAINSNKEIRLPNSMNSDWSYPIKHAKTLYKIDKKEEAIEIIEKSFNTYTEGTRSNEKIIKGFAYLSIDLNELIWAEKYLTKLKDYYAKSQAEYPERYKEALMELIDVKKALAENE